MDYDEKTEERRISKINSAALINLTLKRLWDDFYRHLRNLSYSKANFDLDCLWVELGGDQKEKDKEVKAFTKVETEIVSNWAKVPSKSGFEKYTEEELNILAKQYRLLLKKALFLRRLQNEQGKGTAYEESIDEYMD